MSERPTPSAPRGTRARLRRLEEFAFKGLTPAYLKQLTTATKSKLTRTYNSTAHRSQALAGAVPSGGKKRRAAGPAPLAEEGSEAAEGSPVADEEDEGSDTEDVAAFRKKKRGSGAKKAGAKKKAPAKSGGARKKARK